MGVKLASGREVELKDLTYSQREECEDIPSIITYPNGSMEFKGLAKARSAWCMYGLGVKKEELNKYSPDELIEIMTLVKEKAEQINPTGLDS